MKTYLVQRRPARRFCHRIRHRGKRNQRTTGGPFGWLNQDAPIPEHCRPQKNAAIDPTPAILFRVARIHNRRKRAATLSKLPVQPSEPVYVDSPDRIDRAPQVTGATPFVIPVETDARPPTPCRSLASDLGRNLFGDIFTPARSRATFKLPCVRGGRFLSP